VSSPSLSKKRENISTVKGDRAGLKLGEYIRVFVLHHRKKNERQEYYCKRKGRKGE